MRFRSDRWIAIYVFLGALFVYNANFRCASTSDSMASRFLPFSIWKSHSLTLDSVQGAVDQYMKSPYWLSRSRGGHLVSTFPIVTPVLAAPLYAPAYALLETRGWTLARLASLGAQMEKLSASLFSALSAALMFLLLRRRVSPGSAAVLAAAYALGTETWAISSQALWQHGPAELLLVAALLAITGPPVPGAAAVVGICCGLLVANRPPDAILAAAVFAFLAWKDRRRLPVALFAAAVAFAPFLAYNLDSFGKVVGGYGQPSRPSAHLEAFFRSPRPVGVMGLLLSPGKGLFVFCPFLAFLVLRLRRTRSDGPDPWRALDVCLAAAVALQILLYAGYDWRAGGSYGPRFLTDIVPILIWLLAPVLPRLSRRSRRVFFACIVFSIGAQAVGAFFWPRGNSDACVYGRSSIPLYGGNAWSPACAPFVVELRRGPATPVFLFDAVRAGRRIFR